MALVELSVVEQRYRAVLAVLAGATVTEIAAQLGVSRQTVSGWKSRYEAEGLAGLADRGTLLPKPFTPKELRQTVAAILASKTT